MYEHIPVLSKEIVEYLNPQPGQIIVDGTLGGGGHAAILAAAIEPQGKLIGIDLDPAAIAAAGQKFSELGIKSEFVFVHDSYSNIKNILNSLEITKVNGILVDIGISSYDLEGSNRGFSFQKNEPLDMRYNPEDAPSNKRKEPYTAKFIVNHFQEHELKQLFQEFGEEKFSGRIARAIVVRRQEGTIKTTEQLFETIKKSLPAALRYKAGDSARRIFQALRIEVNHELENLKRFLPQAFDLLADSGRLAVISFHSLEDRIVKTFFNQLAQGCICPPDFPQCVCGQTPKAKILTKKPVVASEEETKNNPRSIPAKLRAIQKI